MALEDSKGDVSIYQNLLISSKSLESVTICALEDDRGNDQERQSLSLDTEITRLRMELEDKRENQKHRTPSVTLSKKRLKIIKQRSLL